MWRHASPLAWEWIRTFWFVFQWNCVWNCSKKSKTISLQPLSSHRKIYLGFIVRSFAIPRWKVQSTKYHTATVISVVPWQGCCDVHIWVSNLIIRMNWSQSFLLACLTPDFTSTLDIWVLLFNWLSSRTNILTGAHAAGGGETSLSVHVWVSLSSCYVVPGTHGGPCMFISSFFPTFQGQMAHSVVLWLFYLWSLNLLQTGMRCACRSSVQLRNVSLVTALVIEQIAPETKDKEVLARHFSHTSLSQSTFLCVRSGNVHLCYSFGKAKGFIG